MKTWVRIIHKEMQQLGLRNGLDLEMIIIVITFLGSNKQKFATRNANFFFKT